jgi:hypothetical protein
MFFRETGAVYSYNHIKHINEICEGTAEFLNVKAVKI